MQINREYEVFVGYQFESKYFNPTSLQTMIAKIVNLVNEEMEKVNIRIKSAFKSIETGKSVSDTVLEIIDRAEICVFEVSDNNPLTYYEFRRAQVKGKKIIFIRHKDSKPSYPSIRHIKCIFYSDDNSLRNLSTTIADEIIDHIREYNLVSSPMENYLKTVLKSLLSLITIDKLKFGAPPDIDEKLAPIKIVTPSQEFKKFKEDISKHFESVQSLIQNKEISQAYVEINHLREEIKNKIEHFVVKYSQIFTYKNYLEAQDRESLLLFSEERIAVIEGVSDLPGEPNERIAILGAFKTYFLMKYVGKIIAKMNLIGVTSLDIFRKNNSSIEISSFRPAAYENMNETLKKIIKSCKKIIILYTIDGGNLIETNWCFQDHKETLGVMLVKSVKPNYEYCKYYSICEDYKGCCSFSGAVGAWFCVKNKCPLSESDTSKMVLDYYIKSSEMKIVALDDIEYLSKLIPKVISS